MVSASVPVEHSPVLRLSPVPDPTTSPEVFRQIYVALDLTPGQKAVIGVTSAIRGEGRTTVALGLAQSLASDLDTPVLLVEADLEHPSLASRLGIRRSPGLTQVLRRQVGVRDVLHPVSDTLSLIPSGGAELDAARLLHQFARDLPRATLLRLAGIVVVDLPPLLTYSYSPLAARVADTLLLVVRAGVTTDTLVRDALSRLEDRPPCGVVLNGYRSALPGWWPGRAH